MAHRIRAGWTARRGDPGGLGGEGKVIEAHETYFGNKDEVTTRTKHGKPGLEEQACRGGAGGAWRQGPTLSHVEHATAETVTVGSREVVGIRRP